ncbi:phage tail sheath C-terminal domain-containing protein [Herpetosiphon gulosus]|uniref:Phage tail sheath protein n=1 Tax=Herpetosiphon gulosus TaxID=1973496 RepID=A0ABP9WY81_9CHLR
MAEVILPGTYITVRDEGLISAGRIASGYIGIVGTAASGPINQVQILGSFSEAKAIFGASDAWQGGTKNELTLVRALEQIYNNGGKTVYAVRSEGVTVDNYKTALAELENEIVNLVLLAGQDNSNVGMANALIAHLTTTAGIKRERIGLIGSALGDDIAKISGHSYASDRLIFVAPGIKSSVSDPATQTVSQVSLPGSYLAAAVAGLIAALPVQSSPTNKTVAIEGLTTNFSASQLEQLVQKRVLVVEKREGWRVVKGITTATNSAWHQITTRRIVDYAIYGVRSACNPYIGKLNNDRVRGAMKATLDAFLTRMVEDEALVGYSLDVSATRAQQIAGEVQVSLTLQPTFSIDFILVTMYLG